MGHKYMIGDVIEVDGTVGKIVKISIYNNEEVYYTIRSEKESIERREDKVELIKKEVMWCG